MSIWIGNDEIQNIGEIKVGNTNVQEVWVGNVKVWPAGTIEYSTLAVVSRVITSGLGRIRVRVFKGASSDSSDMIYDSSTFSSNGCVMNTENTTLTVQKGLYYRFIIDWTNASLSDIMECHSLIETGSTVVVDTSFNNYPTNPVMITTTRDLLVSEDTYDITFTNSANSC